MASFKSLFVWVVVCDAVKRPSFAFVTKFQHMKWNWKLRDRAKKEVLSSPKQFIDKPALDLAIGIGLYFIAVCGQMLKDQLSSGRMRVVRSTQNRKYMPTNPNCDKP